MAGGIGEDLSSGCCLFAGITAFRLVKFFSTNKCYFIIIAADDVSNH